MKGPLQTVIRNLTNKTLNYGPNVAVRANSEFVFAFDPFTEWRNTPSINLERMLIDVRQGRALITYLYDPSFSAAVPHPCVQLSMAAQRIIAGGASKPVVAQPAQKEPVKMEGALPPGQLPEEPKIEREKVTKTTRLEQKIANAAAEAAGITAEPTEAKSSETVEEALKEQNLHRQPDPTTDPQVPAEEVKDVAPESSKKGGRRKKEVVTL